MLMLMSAVETGQMSAVEIRHLSLLLINIYPPQRPTRHFASQSLSPPPGGFDLLRRRRVSEPEAMLGAYVGSSWGHAGSILAPTWPSWPDLGALLG